MRILGISGSLRAGSHNSALLSTAQHHAPQNISWDFAQIDDVPLYNEDLDGAEKPIAVQRLLRQVADADALVIASPEYNYGVPGGLKNAIDWLSRPAYNSVLVGKPTLLMSASMSPAGGVRGQGQLKQIFSGTLTPVYPAPEFTIPSAHKIFQEGRLGDDDTLSRLARLMEGFCAWAQQQPTGPTR